MDVFFVVSGFLITSIILGALERGSFSFTDFYVRRIRRIFPALLVVLLTVLAIGWFVLGADEYRQLGLHVVGGASFSSNFILLKESGYFDIASERKILLHLWSLAIEEQFYLFFPLVIWAAWKLRLRPLLVTLAIAVASFVWNISVAATNTSLDFYSPQTRVWELMIGAALACTSLHASGWLSKVRTPRAERVASMGGMILLGLGAVLITKARHFPGWWALLPTLGTALLIFGGAGSWINRRVLSNPILVWFGLISFPLYLWHWPFLSFAYILKSGTPSWILRLVLVIASIILAWLTYRFVEKPLRFGKHGAAATVCLLVSLTTIGVTGFATYKSGGFENRPVAKESGAYLKTAKLAKHGGDCIRIAFVTRRLEMESFCKIGAETSAPKSFVYGDSHAASMLPAFERYARETGDSFISADSGSCPPLLKVQTMPNAFAPDLACNELNKGVFEYVGDHGIHDVFLIARWTRYNDAFLQPESSASATAKGGDGATYLNLQYGLAQTLEAYRKIGVHVHLVGDNPSQKYIPEDALRKSTYTDDSINAFSVTTDENISAQGGIQDLLSSYRSDFVTVLDFTDIYCSDGICPLVKDGKFLYADLDHLSPSGSLLSYPALKRALDEPFLLPVKDASVIESGGIISTPTDSFLEHINK